MSPEHEVLLRQVRGDLNAYDSGDPDPLQDNAADHIRFLLDQLDAARKPIAEQFAALGWTIASVEDAAAEMDRLSAGWRAEVVKRFAAERAASTEVPS